MWSGFDILQMQIQFFQVTNKKILTTKLDKLTHKIKNVFESPR